MSNRGDEKRARTEQAQQRDAQQEKAGRALNFLRHINSMFPSFRGQVVDQYTLVHRLDDSLISKGIDPAKVVTTSMVVDEEKREFRSVMKTTDDASFLMITHVGVDVKGAQPGYVFTIDEICKHMQSSGNRGINPSMFKDITPVDEQGTLHLELARPSVVSAPLPAAELIEALEKMCTTVGSTDEQTETEIALVHAQQALVSKIRRLQSMGKSLVEIETMTKPQRDEVLELEAAIKEEAATRNAAAMADAAPVPDVLVNPAAPLAGTAEVNMTTQNVIDVVKGFAEHMLESGTHKITPTDLYGTGPGVKPGRALMRLVDRDDAMNIGQAAEHALLEAGWQGMTEEATPASDDGDAVLWTVYVYPVKRGTQDAAPVPGINGEPEGTPAAG